MSNVIVMPEFLNLESPCLARALLKHIVEHAEIVGEDMSGRPVMRFEFVCPPWLMDKLAALSVDGENLEVEPEDCELKGLELGLCR